MHTRSNPRRVLVREDNLETGESGFLTKEAPRGFAPILNLGHDILEHQPRDSNAVTDELMALGAIAYLRWFEGDRRQSYSGGRPRVDARDFASDIYNFFARDVLHLTSAAPGYDDVQSYPIGKLFTPPKASPLPMEHAVRMAAHKEFDSNIDGSIAGDDSYKEEDALLDEANEKWPKYLDAALAWVAFGFERAKRRYGSTPPAEYVRLFEAVNLAVTELARNHGESYPAGSEAVVEYSTGKDGRKAFVRAWFKGAKQDTLVSYGLGNFSKGW